MSILGEHAPGRHPQEEARARARLEILLAGRGTAGAVLKLVPAQRAVLAGDWQGQACVFHLGLGPEAGLAARFEELRRVRAYMDGGPFRVPEPLALLGAGEASVTAFVAGSSLLAAMWAGDDAARHALQTRAAGWLRAHAAPGERLRPANRRPWRSRAEAGLARQGHPALIAVETQVLRRMHQLSRALRGEGAEWRVSLGHGDFHAGNLLLTPGALWGIDLGGKAVAPVCRDIARFLVHNARRGLLPSGRRRYGVDAGGLEAFASAFGLDAVEREGDLPFFLCHELLARPEHPGLPEARISHAREMAEGLLADLRQRLSV
ncbi:phosphotransferase [Pseudooceanicola sp. CBS1P-1]|uniref:Phosphotransferase n=1 Tax=Pseudooceanicola albus TaxID=2692189 RepID=A0A6L7FX02_9RHOB|nr:MULTISPECIES: phosphotransferase [Pseudooceanicola]MBT9383933.1 phosphotransferase [Pseudooceanicola endophyticus]MXN16654.1 phosphotransferase [Pseudooceanicola albus]